MAKKRPRAKSRHSSKSQAAYWRKRLFKNSFTYRGRAYKVNHWSVKIQYLGERRTFSLSASAVREAANEACELYQAIVNRGWGSATAERKEKGAEPHRTPAAAAASKQIGLDASHWSQRLIHRKYTELLQSNGDREFSVRIECAGTSHYFPLGTDNPKIAARNAARIYGIVVKKGWAAACERFPRELSVAFRWSDNPLAWTYTTIHTQTDSQAGYVVNSLATQSAKLNVGIVESDPGIRGALSWCINQQDGCRCVATFASASLAIEEARRRSIDLFLVSQNLTDKPGIECLNQLNNADPRSYASLFSVFEDSEQLFKAAPGGAPCYLFRRTQPTKILAPIDAALKNATFTREHFKKSIRRYFEDVVMSSPIHGSTNELSNLTQREHEILGLLSKGHPDKEIADLLRISTWTVHGHLKKIFEKLGAHNRTDAVVKYLNK